MAVAWEGTNYAKAVYPTNGTPNTGGGGGGRYSSSDGWGSCNPAYGGSGIVIRFVLGKRGQK